MSWIPRKGSPQSQSAERPVPKRPLAAAPPAAPPPGTSLEQPIVLSVSNLSAPIYGTLISLTGRGCRLRTAAVIDSGAIVEFDVPRSSAQPFTASGRVLRRSSMLIASRFEYEISFEVMGPHSSDTLARYVRDMESKAAAARSMQHAISMIPTTDRQRRVSFRAPASFAVSATILNGRSLPASGRCADISTTGMRFLSTADIEPDTILALDFILPSEVLRVHPEETVAIDLKMQHLRSRSTDPRRPFPPIRVQAKVVSRTSGPTYETYGLHFTEIDGLQREEIARFAHAVQLAKIKTAR